MTDLDELIFVDENDFLILPDTFWETDFRGDDGAEDFPNDDPEEAENLRYQEMLCRLDEFELACQAEGDADWPESD